MKKHLGKIIGGAAVVGALIWTSMAPARLPAHTLPPTGWGMTNPDITQANIGQTICNPKWSTKSIRPPASVTTAIKVQQLAELSMGYSDHNTADYEEDHLISLELGGAPKNTNNLWPEPYTNDVGGQNLGAKEKDKVENYLHSRVCSGAETLARAQQRIASNWVAVYAEMIGVKYTGGESTSDNE